MTEKFFPLDKNYILKQAQTDVKDEMLVTFVIMVIKNYLRSHNPLGIVDDTVRKMEDYISNHKEPVSLNGFYENLSAIYRYNNNNTQLVIQWDGGSPYDRFVDEWKDDFTNMVNEFCESDSFMRLVLSVSVFNDGHKNVRILENHLKGFIHTYYSLKVKNKKIKPIKSKKAS